tara:strand:+ start:32389 stop:32796 length:408 start_codon:yes stop_codon:yes gene_type:complete
MINRYKGGVLVPISIGELFDRISVLDVKKRKIKDTPKLQHIESEYKLLRPLCDDLINDYPELKSLLLDITNVNDILWDILETQRNKEKNKELDDEFINISISVYRENDKRFKIKNKINELTSSEIQEQKYYTTGQ